MTKGYVGAVKKMLSEEGLLHHFDSIVGIIGKHYGDSDYDVKCPMSRFEGKAESALKTSKADYIYEVLKSEKLKGLQAVLVEDDPAEISSVRQPHICRAIFVRKQRGMMDAEMNRLRALAGLNENNSSKEEKEEDDDFSWNRMFNGKSPDTSATRGSRGTASAALDAVSSSFAQAKASPSHGRHPVFTPSS